MFPPTHPPLSRRELLASAGLGFGALAATGLLGRAAFGSPHSTLAARPPHHRPRARAVISLFMHGGPSQLDTFDPKPLLARYAGQTLPESYGDLNLEFTKTATAKVLASRRTFTRHGHSGLEISDLFPHVAAHADRLAVVRSCHHTEFNHSPALYLVHGGNRQMGRPSLGAWCTYGLGSEADDLPGYVVMRDGPLKGGPLTYGCGFLPAAHQATELRTAGAPILHLAKPGSAGSIDTRAVLDLAQELNRRHAADRAGDDALSARIAAAELAFRMQAAAPEAIDLSRETADTHRLYGLDQADTRSFGSQCLIARRLVERGVRFVQLYHGGGNTGWDTHGNNDGQHRINARQTDQPIAALLHDLAARGLLDSTLVLWGGEFGRTPTSEGADGRDHSPYGFSVWLAGGGVRGGTVHGATDDFGFRAVEKPVPIRDLHATILHLLGLSHEELTFLFQGLDQKLTGVEPAQVIRELLA
jgi:hypothetical protein